LNVKDVGSMFIAYGVPESISMDVPQQIVHDRQFIGNILWSPKILFYIV